MTDQEILKQVREAGGKWLANEQSSYTPWESIPMPEVKEMWRKKFDRLLSEVFGPGWRLAVVSTEVKLPEIREIKDGMNDKQRGFIVGQQREQYEMLNAGFVQEIRKGE